MVRKTPKQRALENYQKALSNYDRKRNRLLQDKDIPYDMWYTPQKRTRELRENETLTTWDIKRNTKILQNMTKRGAEKIITFHKNQMPKGLKENTKLSLRHINKQKKKINEGIRNDVPKEQMKKIPKSDRFNQLAFYLNAVQQASGNYQKTYGDNYKNNYLKAIKDNFSSADNKDLFYNTVANIDSATMIQISFTVDGLYIKDMYPAKGQENFICNELTNRWRKSIGLDEIDFDEELESDGE